MEEKILEILDQCFEKVTLPGIGENPVDEGFVFNHEKFAKEIAEMNREFIEWKDKNVCFYNSVTKWYWLDEQVRYTLDDLFNYWYNEIREK